MEGSVYSKVIKRLIPLLILGYLIAYIDRTVVGYAQLGMSVDLGIGAAAFGFGAGVFFIAYAIFEVPSNLILTKVGARRWFVRIMITWGVVTMAMALAQGPISFYILRFLLGVAEAGFYPGILFFITQWFPSSRRAGVIGMFLLANPIGLAIGGPLAGSLLSLDGLAGLAGWQWLFLGVGAPAIILAFVLLRYLPDHPGEARWLSEEERETIRTDLAQDAEDTGARHFSNPLRALGEGKVLLLTAFFIVYPLTGYGLALWLPTIIDGFGVSAMTNGWLSTIPWVFAALALYLIPRRADRKGTPYAHIAITLALGGIGLFGSTVFGNSAIQLAFLSLAAFGIFAGQPIFWSIPSRLLTGASAAAGLAFVNSIGSLGGFIGPFGVGAVQELFNSQSAGMYFLAGWAVYGLAMLIAVYTVLERRRNVGVGSAAPVHGVSANHVEDKSSVK